MIAAGELLVVIEEDTAVVEDLRRKNIPVIEGPGAPRALLSAANVGRAHRLFVAIPSAFEAAKFIEIALAANETIGIVVRAHSDAQAAHLRSLGTGVVVMGEREIGLAMAARAVPAPAAAPV